jgi:hypothetical protein
VLGSCGKTNLPTSAEERLGVALDKVCEMRAPEPKPLHALYRALEHVDHDLPRVHTLAAGLAALRAFQAEHPADGAGIRRAQNRVLNDMADLGAPACGS